MTILLELALNTRCSWKAYTPTSTYPERHMMNRPCFHPQELLLHCPHQAARYFTAAMSAHCCNGCSCRQGKQHHSSRNLPPEIWQRIARYLGPTEWAKVAGMCRSTWRLQLDSVRMKPWYKNEKLCDKGANAVPADEKRAFCEWENWE